MEHCGCSSAQNLFFSLYFCPASCYVFILSILQLWTYLSSSAVSSRRFARRVLLTFLLSLGHFQSFWVHLEISEQNKSYCLNKTHNSRYIESVLESHDFRGLSATNFILVLKKMPSAFKLGKIILDVCLLCLWAVYSKGIFCGEWNNEKSGICRHMLL